MAMLLKRAATWADESGFLDKLVSVDQEIFIRSSTIRQRRDMCSLVNHEALKALLVKRDSCVKRLQDFRFGIISQSQNIKVHIQAQVLLY